ncbi:MAG: hypothetical protein K9J16_14640 [Melioribacteraceae bacterium]|nr:hypothetical protein [Melioribacteraceae bacterium]MCF8356358.1 hypothetical protein [Melioribacteraceae bacterium]MCF8395797.1 hypothetical protein [Melioribacteraceae bacterium]MCF8420662.1 hypothetical protein [Melioribacteraceae bacterium]
MKITRIYSDENSESVFSQIDIKLKDSGQIGKLSESYPVSEIIFRVTEGNYNYDFHNAPQRQFILILDGEIEIETSLGEKRRFKSGDIILVEDTKGKGHRTKSIDGKLRRSVFVTLGDNNVEIERYDKTAHG